MSFKGKVNGSLVQVLLDGGSTDNFIQSRAANFLNLKVEALPRFSMVVGSGQYLRCEGVIRNVTLMVQWTKLQLDFYVLALHGADLYWVSPG